MVTQSKTQLCLALTAVVCALSATAHAADGGNGDTAQKYTPTITIGETTSGGSTESDTIASKITSGTEVTINNSWFGVSGSESGSITEVTLKPGSNGNASLTVEGTLNFGSIGASSAPATVKVHAPITVASGGTFSNSAQLTFEKSGSDTGKLEVKAGSNFTNKGTMTFGSGTSFDISLADLKTSGDQVSQSFTNSGSITLSGGGTMTIKNESGSSAPVFENDKDPNQSFSFGNITVDGTNSKLTSSDYGYYVKDAVQSGSDSGSSGETKEGETKQTHYARVIFGNVTLKSGGTFVNDAKAIDSGNTLTIDGTSGTKATIQGESSWATISIDMTNHSGSGKEAVTVSGSGASLSTQYLSLQNVTTGSNIANVVATSGSGTFAISKGISIESFANGGSFTLDGTPTKSKDASSTGSDRLADGAGLTFGSSFTLEKSDSTGKQADASTLIDKWKQKDQNSGTVTISGYTSTFIKDESSSSSSGTDDGKTESLQNLAKLFALGTAKEGDNNQAGSGSGDDANNGSSGSDNENKDEVTGTWTVPSFGSVAVYGKTTLNISNNKWQKNTTANQAKLVYSPALQISSLGAVEDWLTAEATVTVDTSQSDYKDWVDENGKLTESGQNAIQSAVDAAIPSGSVSNPSTIINVSGSDLAIGSLVIKKNEDTFDVSKVVSEDTGGGDEQPATTADEEENTKHDFDFSGSKSIQQNSAKISITGGSHIDIGTWTQETGTVDISGSAVTVDNVQTLNGTLNIKSGWVALNSSDTIANHYAKKEESGSGSGSEGGSTGGDDNSNGGQSQSLYAKLFATGTQAKGSDTGASTGPDGEGTPDFDGMKDDQLSGSRVVTIGGSVTVGTSGVINFGEASSNGGGTYSTASTSDSTSGTEEAPSTAKINFYQDTTLQFDASNGAFAAGQLFATEAQKSEDGSKTYNGTVTVSNGAKVTIKATNLTWGAYNLFENFDIASGSESKFEVKDSTASEIWKNQVGTDGIKWQDGKLVVGGTTISGSGLENVIAPNLVNTVVGGDRSSSPDLQVVNLLLGIQTSIGDIRNSIDSLAGIGAISSVNAMATDFGSYTADQVEHHAVTIPHNFSGWWAMPIGSMYRTDDLKVGATTTGYKINTFGIMGGYDHKVDEDNIVGISASWQKGNASSLGSAMDTKTDARNYGLSFWGAHHMGLATVTGSVSYTKTTGDVSMPLYGLGAQTSMNAVTYAANVRLDYHAQFGAVNVIPHIGARVSHTAIDDYNISVAGLQAFSVKDDSSTIFEVPVGVSLSTNFDYLRWKVRPYVDLTARARFGDTDSSYTLEGSKSSDVINYQMTSRYIGDAKIGWMSSFQNLNLGMSYGVSAGDRGRMNQTIEATMRVFLK